jgi:SWI/SNF-related matrix-associated actin-dependent regulator of chromatin subfamily A member 5
MQGNFSNYAG